jgi:hypothetical protein
MSGPLVVNLKDGSVWTRREATRDGVALYALTAMSECPEFVMATYAELEKHGIAGQTDALPVPVGPERLTPQERDMILGLIGDAKPARSSLLLSFGESVHNRREHEHPQWEDFYCLNLSSYMGERTAPVLRRLVDVEAENELLRARVAELEAAQGAKTEPLIVDADGAEPTPLRWGLNDVMWGDDDTVTVLLSDPDGQPFWLELEPSQAAVLRDDLAGPDGPAVFRATWDTEQCGPLYGREDAARAHCEHDARIDYPDGTPLAWRVFTDDCAELFAVVGGKEGPTGYTVTRLPLASEYEEEADE